MRPRRLDTNGPLRQSSRRPARLVPSPTEAEMARALSAARPELAATREAAMSEALGGHGASVLEPQGDLAGPTRDAARHVQDHVAQPPRPCLGQLGAENQALGEGEQVLSGEGQVGPARCPWRCGCETSTEGMAPVAGLEGRRCRHRPSR